MGKPFVKKEIAPQDGSDKCHQAHAHCMTTHRSQVRIVKKIMNHIKSSKTMRGVHLDHFDAGDICTETKHF